MYALRTRCCAAHHLCAGAAMIVDFLVLASLTKASPDSSWRVALAGSRPFATVDRLPLWVT